jgi:hypothetical protein
MQLIAAIAIVRMLYHTSPAAPEKLVRVLPLEVDSLYVARKPYQLSFSFYPW